MEKIVSLAKRRGFVYPGSEIYGGLANTFDYGPLGVELLRNIISLWWKTFVHKRDDMFGLDSAILMSPKVWEASGHTASFTDVMVDCKSCKIRTRADHLIEDHFESQGKEKKVEGFTPEELTKIMSSEKIKCPSCGKVDWTAARRFNLLFETKVGIVPENQSQVYLRGEIAQGMFVNFKNVLDSFSPKLPFGIAQAGKAFRNEITKGNFIFRTLEFNLAEFEYFFNPKKEKWEDQFKYWQDQMWEWTTKTLNINAKNLRWRPHTDEERSHYSKRTEDIEYKFPFGFKELYGLAYRTDFDLKNHTEKSGVDLTYFDQEANERFIPHVIEPTFGISRTFLALLVESYSQDGDRKYLKLDPKLAPYKAAVFPLLANKPDLVKKAKSIYDDLKKDFNVDFDDRGNIGKRYFSQDEIGTPYCITIDFQTLEDDTVTIRDRDNTRQERVKVTEINAFLQKSLS